MHEELVKALRFCAEKANNWNCPDCPGFDSLCSTGKQIRTTAADALETMSTQFADLRNELCQQCGKYRMAHKWACDGCRWRTPAKQDEDG